MPTDIIKQILEFWKNLNKRVKSILTFSLIGAVVIAVAVPLVMSIKNYDVLYSGLSSSEQAEIVSRLGELSVDFKTKSGGIVLIPSKCSFRRKDTPAAH